MQKILKIVLIRAVKNFSSVEGEIICVLKSLQEKGIAS